MCTMIAEKIKIEGSTKGGGDWFRVNQVNVSYDHPYHFPQEHALNLDFVDAVGDPGKRVAVELSLEAGRALVETIQAVLERARVGGYLEIESAKPV